MRALLSRSDLRAAPTSFGTQVHYKIAEDLRERAVAFRLCHDVYVQAGLMLPCRSQLQILPQHLLPTSTVIVAVQGGQVIGAMSLIGDDQLGLPMECAYRDEAAELRNPCRWLGEVSALACDPRQPRCQLGLLGNLTRLLAQYAQSHHREPAEQLSYHPVSGAERKLFAGMLSNQPNAARQRGLRGTRRVG